MDCDCGRGRLDILMKEETLVGRMVVYFGSRGYDARAADGTRFDRKPCSKDMTSRMPPGKVS